MKKKESAKKEGIDLFIAQIINAFVNNSYLLFGLLFSSTQILGELFVFNSLYTLLVATIRFAYGGREYLLKSKEYIDSNYYLRMLSLYAIPGVILFLLLTSVLRVYDHYSLLILIGATSGLFYEILRIDLVNIRKIKYQLTADVVMLLTNCIVISCLFFKIDFSYQSLLNAWCISNLSALLSGCFIARKKFRRVNRKVKHNRKVFSFFVLIPVLTSGVNYLINEIWRYFAGSDIIGFGRGFTLFFLPVNFILNLFPLIYIKKQKIVIPVNYIFSLIYICIISGGAIGYIYYLNLNSSKDILTSFVLITIDYVLISLNTRTMNLLILDGKIDKVVSVRFVWGISYLSLSFLCAPLFHSTLMFAVLTLLCEVIVLFHYKFFHQSRRKFLSLFAKNDI